MSAPRWLPPLLWAGVIVFATSVPTTLVPRRLAVFDKAIHFGIYAVLAALLTRAVLAGPSRLRWALAIVVCVAGVAAFGAVDEWHQQFIPGRSTEFADWVADSTGAVVGTIGFALFARQRSRVTPA